MLLPGVITLHERIDKDGAVNLGIVDGQHRVAALKILASEGCWDENAPNILVDVFRLDSDAAVKDLFSDINRSEPVRLVDLPDEGASVPVKMILNQAVSELQERYPAMFKVSQQCRPPHVNI